MIKLLLVPIALGVFFAWLIVRRIAIRLRALQAQLAAYRRGDYEGQLRVIEAFRVGNSEPGHYLFFRGSACYQLGRLQEAEQSLRRSLAMETNAQLRTVCRDEVGRVLMEQGRWEDAEDCFRECIAEWPRRGGGHRSVAELLLRSKREKEAALCAARLAEVLDRRASLGVSKLGKEDYSVNLSESLAVLAWALAASGAGAEAVAPVLKEAFELCPETTKPVRAELHYFAASAYADLANESESRRHFHRALEVDPIGNYGRLAGSAMVTAVH
jgi:tetratricopeptide (TPR) repeat protein